MLIEGFESASNGCKHTEQRFTSRDSIKCGGRGLCGRGTLGIPRVYASPQNLADIISRLDHLETGHRASLKNSGLTNVSKTKQTAMTKERKSSFMEEKILILTTERDGDDGLIVTFSDGTTGAYVAEELLELRPYRERVETRQAENKPVRTLSPPLPRPGHRTKAIKDHR